MANTKRRRSRGEGGLSTRMVHGRLRWVASLTDANGKRKFLYGETQAEARRKLEQAKQAKKLGLSLDRRPTLEDWIATWLREKAEDVTEGTLRNYAVISNKHLVPALGKIRLDELRVDEVNRLLQDKLKSGLSKKYTKEIRVTLWVALADAMRKDPPLVTRNVAALSKPIKQEQAKPIEFYNDEQVSGFLEAAREEPASLSLSLPILAELEPGRNFAYWYTVLKTGLRPSEAMGLRWADVDLDARRIVVTQQLHRKRGGGWELGDLKTGSSVRVLQPLPLKLIDVLREHRARQAAERLITGQWAEDHGLVFASTLGTPLHLSAMRREWESIRNRAGLPKLRMYGARHTTASNVLDKLKKGGVSDPMAEVSKLLGHSDEATTRRFYANIRQAGAEVMAALDA